MKNQNNRRKGLQIRIKAFFEKNELLIVIIYISDFKIIGICGASRDCCES